MGTKVFIESFYMKLFPAGLLLQSSYSFKKENGQQGYVWNNTQSCSVLGDPNNKLDTTKLGFYFLSLGIFSLMRVRLLAEFPIQVVFKTAHETLCSTKTSKYSL